MGASCVDSTRILLNSKSERYPNGIGNGSDVIGRYLCEQIRVQRHRLPARALRHADRRTTAASAASTSTCRASTTARAEARLPARLRHAVLEHRREHPGATAGARSAASRLRRALQAEIKRRTRRGSRLHPFGEVLPYAHNRITVDASQADRYGVPLLKIDYQIGDNERKMTEHMDDTVEEIVQGGRRRAGELSRAASSTRWARPSTSTARCRMGADPKRSALNAFNQMHEVKNVFVVDGSAFTNASREEPDADHPRALVARDRPSRRRDQARLAVKSAKV